MHQATHAPTTSYPVGLRSHFFEKVKDIIDIGIEHHTTSTPHIETPIFPIPLVS
ncbi:MAG: hypothetical protein ACE5R6_00445 [Candidatus Heimdallarchaeota archaeon]